MQIISEFLVNNWQYISSALLVCLTLLSIILKRHPTFKDKFLEIGKSLIGYVPSLISMVEGYDLSGIAKKEKVMEYLLDIFEEKLGRDLTKDEFKRFYDTFSSYIERILETPTKKGGHGREDEK